MSYDEKAKARMVKYMQSKSKKRMKHRKKQIFQLKTMSTNKL